MSVGVSANGHALLSGHGVPAAGTLVGFAVMLAVGWAITGRERGGPTIVGWMLWGQLALHLVFGAAQSGPAAPAHHTAPDLTAVDSGAGMLGAHLVAALLCAAWLRRGEAAAHALARELRILLCGVLLRPAPPPVVPYPPPRTSTGAEPERDRRPPLLRHAVIRRGPPHPRFG